MLKHLIKSVDLIRLSLKDRRRNSIPGRRRKIFFLMIFFLSTDNTVRVQRKETAVIISQYSSLVFNSRRL